MLLADSIGCSRRRTLGLPARDQQRWRAEYTALSKPPFDVHEWSRIEFLWMQQQGPPGWLSLSRLVAKRSSAGFQGPHAGRVGPIALQMNNAGLFDEYKDVSIELDPKEDELITTE